MICFLLKLGKCLCSKKWPTYSLKYGLSHATHRAPMLDTTKSSCSCRAFKKNHTKKLSLSQLYSQGMAILSTGFVPDGCVGHGHENLPHEGQGIYKDVGTKIFPRVPNRHPQFENIYEYMSPMSYAYYVR